MSTAASCRRLAGALVQLAGGIRQLSTHKGELPSLKHALREIYKQVHPDLFHDYQPAREANTRSFKMLQEYLEAARKGSHVPLPYRFHFYIRAQEAAATGSGSSGSSGGSGSGTLAAPLPPQQQPPPAAPAGLREVTLTLPPPTRGAPGEDMSGGTRKAFGSLLTALGLPGSFAGAGEGDGVAREYNRFVSLREFLPQAVEAVHQHAAAQSSAQHQLAALRTALRLGRHVTAGLVGPAAAGGPLQQLPLLRRLLEVLDDLPPSLDLSGLKVMVGQASGVDTLGTVWLAADGSREAWARHLSGVDAGYCRERQQLLRQVKSQEASVAQLLGVGMLYTQQEASLGPGYREALERLAAAAAARGPAGGGRFRELPVMLQPAGAGGSSSGSGGDSSGGGGGGATSSGNGTGGIRSGGDGFLGGCTADSTAGVLLAPMDVTPEALYAAVQQLGGQLLAVHQRRRQMERQLTELRTQVERKVMLRRLLRDPAVSDTRFKSCLDRMLGNAQKLSGLLHGQAVRVAEVNSLSPDNSVINIAWNWQL